MTRRDPEQSMRDMLKYARKAVCFMEGKTQADLVNNDMLSMATRHAVEIIGEAANRVPQEVRDQHPQISWKEIVGTRNRIAHGYDIVDMRLLWDILSLDLPPLVAELEKIVG